MDLKNDIILYKEFFTPRTASQYQHFGIHGMCIKSSQELLIKPQKYNFMVILNSYF